MKKLIAAFVVLCAISLKAYSTTYYAVADGSWTAGSGVWSTSSGGPANISWATISSALVNGDVLEITSDLTVTGGNVTIAPLVTVNLKSTSSDNASLTFSSGGKLIFSNTSSTMVLSNTTGNSANDPAIIDGSPGGGNSDLISIGGNTVWDSTSPDPTAGTGTITSSSSPGAPLPVVLLFFQSEKAKEGIHLTWATASELNFDYFSLQRSGDGLLFNEIAQVKGHGTTNEMSTYTYDDTNPIIGRSYYRLKSIDFDAYEETFRVVSVEYHGEKRFHVSDNPSDGSMIKLNFNFETSDDGQVTIFDNVGSTVGTYRLSGSSTINFENTLKSGVYLARYASSSFTKTERFLVK